MLTIKRLKELFELQEQLEVHISGSDWRNANHNYPLCIHMECAELIDHFGWKHWKNIDCEVDTIAIAMELVDVWHFAMAFLLSHKEFNADIIHMQLTDAIEEYQLEEKKDPIDLCIGMGYSAFATGKFPFGNFIALMTIAEMDFDDLYVLYISKNVLNWFRQDHGYKEGTYVKNWGGQEDNTHLMEISNSLGSELNAKSLYEGLKLRYELIVH